MFIPLVVGVISFLYIQMYNKSFELSLEELERDKYAIAKSTIKDKISGISDLIVYQKSVIQADLKARVKNRVDVAYKIADNILHQYENTKTDKEIQSIIKTSLKPFVWNNGESFIYMLDYDGVFKLAPSYLNNLEGTSIINLQDATGKYIIKEEIKICKTSGEGFMWDTFTKPSDNTKQYKQLVFVKDLGHYNWYLRSGEYLDSATTNTNKALLETIKQIDNIANRHIFVLQADGTMLVNKTIPNHIGKNISEISNDYTKSTMKKIMQNMQNKNSAFMSYDWMNLQTENIEEKLSYIMKVPGTDWIIGTGFYLKDIENKIALKKNEMYKVYYDKSQRVVYLAVFVMIITLLISYYISTKIKESFSRYESRINFNNKELKELNEDLEQKVQDRTMELHKSEYNLQIKNDILEKLSRHDGLTGIANRRYFDENFELRCKESLREKTSLVIMMIDIDCFKDYNDHYGHAKGDEVLKRVAVTLQGELRRPSDMVARYGGEEFVVLLKATDRKGASKLASSLLKAIEDLNIHHEYSIATNVISISIGVSYIDGHDTVDKEALLKEADDCLYEAKSSGRNKVVMNNT